MRDARRERMLRLIKALVLGVLCVYAARTATLYLFQRQVIYRPYTEALGAPAASGVNMATITTTTADGLALTAWFAPPPGKDGKVVVLFHGNGGDIANRALYKAPILLQHRYGLLLCEYRGYGGNPGSPSEQGLYADARASLAWLAQRGYKPAQLIYYGESIGSGVAVQMALEAPPSLLVLESPISSLSDVGKVTFPDQPVDMLLKDHFDNVSKIGSIRVPLLIAHGDKDKVVPMALGKKLFDAARAPKDFIVIEGADHNDMYVFGAGEKITAWLDRKTGKAK